MPIPNELLDDPPDDHYRGPVSSDVVPTFYLYGEPHRAVSDGFVHVEHLDDRSRPSAWRIRPHAHPELLQMFAVTTGGGAVQVEHATLAFEAPALVIMPATTVHGFTWRSESAGSVLTLACSCFAQITHRYPELEPVFGQPDVVRPAPRAMTIIRSAIDTLMQELSWAAPGHAAAVDAALLAILTTALRTLDPAKPRKALAQGRQATLVARFRERLNDRFRLRESIADHAAALGTSESRLRAACARIAAMSPSAMIDQRAMLEARRALLYSNLSIAEVGYAIGFADPAYFTRFFIRRSGQSPSQFRRHRARATE